MAIPFSDFFSTTQFDTQTETLETHKGKKPLVIGIPREESEDSRVALVPNSIRSIVGFGHQVLVEAEAGIKSNYTNHHYAEAGSNITYAKDEVYKADLIIKISPIRPYELELMNDGTIVIAPTHQPTMTENIIDTLKRKRIIAIASEQIKNENGQNPIVSVNSEIEGTAAVQIAAELLSNTQGGRGVLLGGISGVPPAKVVVLGAGAVAEHAIRQAMNTGASVRVFDNDTMKLMELQKRLGQRLHTSTINAVYLGYQLVSADVVIGAMHSETGRTPIIVTEEMVSRMKDGSVIIDTSIYQGGCIETSEITTLQKPTFIKHGVIHYCVPNTASKYSRTASVSISNIITPIIIKMGNSLNIESLLSRDQGIRNACYTYRGAITNKYLSKKYNLKYTDINLLLTSKF